MDPRDKPTGPIGWMATNGVAANLLMLVFLVGGFLMLGQIKQEVFPDFVRDSVTVSVFYPGASPEEVEEGIVLPVEEAVRGINGIDEVTSVANEGSGRVTLELINGADIQKVKDDVQSEIDRIRTFPDDAEDPVVAADSRRRDVLTVLLHGNVSRQSLYEWSERLRDDLTQHPEITQLEVEGLPDLEIEVAVSADSLRRYGLTMRDVANRVQAAALDLPGGSVKTAGGDVLVRLAERREFGREFADLPILTNPDGSRVLLREIATVTDGFEDSDRYATWNGEPAVMIEVYRVGQQTPITVSEGTHEVLEAFRSELPPGLSATIVDDRSEHYRERVQLLLKNGAIGLVLVLFVLGIFLEGRLAFWVSLGIPISFMGSFIFLPMTGVSLNMISLFAYIIAIGIVVDDAIVVGENIYHYHQDEGLPFWQAAIRGARDVATPVTFSILTNIACFMPLYFVPGTMGKIFQMIPVVVTIAFLVSLVESLFILPAHLGHQRDPEGRGLGMWLHRRQQAFSNAFRHWVRDGYGPVLSFLLKYRYATVGAGFCVLLVTLSFALSGRLGFDLFPSVEGDYARATLVLPYGSPVEKTDAVVRRMVRAAQEVRDETGHPELMEGIFADLGRGGAHAARVQAYLAGADVRERLGISTAEFANRWQERVGQVPGVETLRFDSEGGGPGGGRGLTVQLSHRSLDTLRDAAAELADVLLEYPQVTDVDDGFQPGKEQLDFSLTPMGRSLGLTAIDVARQVRAAFYGAEAVQQLRGRSEVKVMVRLPEAERRSLESIEDFMVRTPSGTFVPLREVVHIDRGRAYMNIDRQNGRRVVQVTADVRPRNQAVRVQTSLSQEVLPQLRQKFPGLTASFEGRQAQMRESVGSLRVSFVIAMLVVYALLAIPFKSYLQPLIIMTAIPFGVVGAIFGHLLMGYSMSLMSLFGVVALSGVVINDSLVLIDFTNYEQRDNNHPPAQAVLLAAIQRFRPVLLTTLTTFFGLAPMIFETSRQARFLIPMALSLGFGIIFGTIITLLLIPCLYLIFDDVLQLFVARPKVARRGPPIPVLGAEPDTAGT